MKVNGKTPKASDPRPCIFSRIPKEDSIIIMVHPVPDKTEFKKRFPEPQPPKKKYASGKIELLIDSPEYKQALIDHSTLYSNWLILTSIQANTSPDGVNFDTVKLSDPNTWANWETEMREDGFVEGEIAYLVREITSICGYNPQGYIEARESFLSEMLLEPAPAYPAVAAVSMSSGEPVNDGASSPAN